VDHIPFGWHFGVPIGAESETGGEPVAFGQLFEVGEQFSSRGELAPLAHDHERKQHERESPLKTKTESCGLRVVDGEKEKREERKKKKEMELKIIYKLTNWNHFSFGFQIL